MKTLALTILITINSFSFAFAQTLTNEINSITLNVEFEDGMNLVSWESNKEVNTSYYIIESSLNGENFELLTTQKAGSSTYQKTNYSYEDLRDNQGQAQYRITLVMMDGSTLSTLSNQVLEENVVTAIAK